MSLAETVEKSDFQMNEAERAEFAERVLLDDEEIVAAFKVYGNGGRDPRSIVFTSVRLVIETDGNERHRWSGERHLKRLTSIPYASISVYSVVLNVSGAKGRDSGVLRLWVPGYYDDNGQSNRWVDIEDDGRLDLYMLSGILTSQMRAERTK